MCIRLGHMGGVIAQTSKTFRAKPSQRRGKERVRAILIAALEAFKEKGLEHVTTNDIAKRAGIPIGSLYRYYPNKNAIVVDLLERYVSDISKIFAVVGKHPMLQHLSWEEVLLLMVDDWVRYVRQNGSFALLYAVKANPRLMTQNRKTWELLLKSFGKVIKKRCPAMSEKDILLCFQFCLASAEMGINREEYEAMGLRPHYEAVSVLASYMLHVCSSLSHHGDDGMLS
jgi:hypothetical protein